MSFEQNIHSSVSSASHLLNRLSTSQGFSANEVEDLRGILTHIISTESTPEVSQQNEPKVSQPQYFSGDRKQLPELLTQVKIVIAMQPSRLPKP